MPYINPEDRDRFDEPIRELVDSIMTPGHLNYVFSKIATSVWRESEGNYTELNAIAGVFGLAKAEFIRREVVPYEEDKLEENGDLYDHD